MSTAMKKQSDEETRDQSEERTLTLAQRAGYARRRLKNRGITTLTDHHEAEVPLKYVPDIDLLKHAETLEILERAEALARELAAFKFEVQKKGDELHRQLMKEDEVRDNSVGGFTLATFNKSLKVIYAVDSVQVKIPEQLKMAQESWKNFLDDYYGDKDEKDRLMIEMVNELLHNQKDQIDLRNIGRLNRMGSKIKNKNYHKFLDHLNQAYDTEHTKRYEQFKKRTDQGDFDSVVLTYSSIDPRPGDNE